MASMRLFFFFSLLILLGACSKQDSDGPKLGCLVTKEVRTTAGSTTTYTTTYEYNQDGRLDKISPFPSSYIKTGPTSCQYNSAGQLIVYHIPETTYGPNYDKYGPVYVTVEPHDFIFNYDADGLVRGIYLNSHPSDTSGQMLYATITYNSDKRINKIQYFIGDSASVKLETYWRLEYNTTDNSVKMFHGEYNGYYDKVIENYYNVVTYDNRANVYSKDYQTINLLNGSAGLRGLANISPNNILSTFTYNLPDESLKYVSVNLYQYGKNNQPTSVSSQFENKEYNLHSSDETKFEYSCR